MIKNFIYVDEYKLQSLSAQVFSGVTDYLIKDYKGINSKLESQRGPIGSGRDYEDTDVVESSVSERKSLHDFAFVQFEKHLIENNKVIEVNSGNISSKIERINESSFIKVTGSVAFNDMDSLKLMMKNFNNFGEALTFLNFTNEHGLSLKSNADKSKLHNFKKDIKRVAQECNLRQDEDFIKYMTYLIEFGYDGQFEFNLDCNGVKFISPLDRNNLRESEKTIINKYSRHTMKEFTLFGIITQSGPTKNVDLRGNNFSNLKNGIRNLINHLANIENTYSGRDSSEFVVEPLAIYTEL
ncbi:DUF6414 family protein [Enterovibrio baiacu]|uniref:DUF6414 family protein n=1 Tax=Enterovibrio baiacu TaxID=2491023 RepID=UPI0010111822|nr:hypothetical protein [Enterovibrio baiacu]MBE1273412.1 hypothetical protein [Enterovibrio baiacu]